MRDCASQEVRWVRTLRSADAISGSASDEDGCSRRVVQLQRLSTYLQIRSTYDVPVRLASEYTVTSLSYYPRESEGICFHQRWFVCVFVCLSMTTITKNVQGFAPNFMRRFLGGKKRPSSCFVTIGRGMWK